MALASRMRELDVALRRVPFYGACEALLRFLGLVEEVPLVGHSPIHPRIVADRAVIQHPLPHSLSEEAEVVLDLCDEELLGRGDGRHPVPPVCQALVALGLEHFAPVQHRPYLDVGDVLAPVDGLGVPRAPVRQEVLERNLVELEGLHEARSDACKGGDGRSDLPLMVVDVVYCYHNGSCFSPVDVGRCGGGRRPEPFIVAVDLIEVAGSDRGLHASI